MQKPMANRFIFLIVVLLLYVVAYFFNSAAAIEAAHFSLSLGISLLPILVLVFGIMFLSNLLLKSQWIKANLGRDSGPKAWLIAVIAGIFSPGPIYPWLALLKELKEQGMRPGLIAVFLYSRGIKLPMLPLLIHYFGLMYSLLLLFYIPLFALLSGVLIERYPGSKESAE